MKPSLLNVFVVLVAGGVAGTGVARANLVVNGDFGAGLTGWSTFYGDTGTTPTGANQSQISADAAVGNPLPSAKLDRVITTAFDNKDFIYQLIPVSNGEQYVLDADWRGDLQGTGGTATNARNWAEVYVAFFPSGTTITDAAQLPDAQIRYKKRWDVAGGSGTLNVDQSGIFDWESILSSPDTSAVPGPTDGTFTASDELMLVGFNIGGRAASGVANFNVDNVSLTVVPEPAALGMIAMGGLALLWRRSTR